MSVFPAEPFDGTQEITVDAVPIAVIRHSGLRMSDLAKVFDPAYTAFGRAFAEGMLTPAGPALAIYHGDPMATFDLEIGFPVASVPTEPLPVDGLEITASALPQGKALATSHVGGYAGLGDSWGRVYAEAVQRGVRPTGDWVEAYVSDPRTTAEADLRTDLILRTEV